MSSVLAESLPSNPPVSAPAPRWTRFVDFVVRRRVHLTLIAFAILIAEDILAGVKPHDLFNGRDAHTDGGLALVAAGLLLRTWAAGTLTKWAELTTDGPYGVMRHPLYVGSFLMMIGFCLIIDDPENIWIVLGPMLAMYLLAVRKEERNLRQRYGLKWDAYTQETSAFLPRRLPKRPLTNWSGRQWLNNREYQAVLASFAGLGLLQLWRIA